MGEQSKPIQNNKLERQALDRSVLRDYLSLTVALTIGVAGTIFIFVASVNYNFRDAHYQFQHEVDEMAAELNLQFRNVALNFELLNETLANRPFSQMEMNQLWIESRVGPSNFTCAYVQDLSLKSRSVNRTAIIVGHETWCEDFGKNFSSWDKIESWSGDPKGAGALVRPIVHAEKIYLKIYKPLGLKDRVLTALLPIETLLSKKNLKSAQGRMESVGDVVLLTAIPAGKDGAMTSQRRIKISLLDNPVGFLFTPKDNSFKMDMRWPWALFLLCFFFVVLLSVFLYSIINRSRIVSQEVLHRTADLKHATEEALEANQTKSRFLANVSHEIRTPLNLILGMAELLSETKIDDEQRDYVNSFQKAGRHLLDIINDILDITQIEAGNSKALIEVVDLVELVQSVSNTVAPACRKRKLHYSHILSPDLPRKVNTDAKRLRQILINLINNAIKFTYEGEVVLRVNYVDQTLEIKVSDTGIGIAKADQQRIFEEFFQVDTSSKRRNTGVGLGLAIVRKCLDVLGGIVGLESRLGEGSEFTVHIPTSPASEGSWLDPYKKSKLCNQVASIGLQPNQISFLRDSFATVGCQFQTVGNFRILSRKLAINPNQFDFILINVEGHSGEPSVFEEMTSLNVDKSKFIVILPLAHRKDDLVQLRNLGVTSLIYTPIDMDRLFGVMAKRPEAIAATSAENKAVEAPVEVKRPTPSRGRAAIPVNLPRATSIIVAEDDADNQFLIKSYLLGLDLDLDLQFAANGKDALRIYNNSEKCDVLITDIQMPIMDGLELIDEIRKYEKTNYVKRTKIIVLTADAQSEQRSRVLGSGADDYITKPIGKAGLISSLQKVLLPKGA